jgi:hypothetical protein
MVSRANRNLGAVCRGPGRTGLGQRFIDTACQVLLAQLIQETRARQNHHRLSVHTRQDYARTVSLGQPDLANEVRRLFNRTQANEGEVLLQRNDQRNAGRINPWSRETE